MIDGVFQGRGMKALEKGIEALNLRHRVIADNIANANTPGFKKTEVSFTQELSRYLSQSERPGGAQRPFEPKAYRVNTTSHRLDGNNVDIEQEMARLAENTLLYEAVARQLSQKLTFLRLAITEGRR